MNSLRQPWATKLAAAQFHFRRALAKLPYVPVPVRLKMSANEEIEFRWSYVVPFHDPTKGFFDYWGHDLADLRFLWRALKPGMVFFDIGAYHGIYTLVAAKRLGAEGQIVAFEPSPCERRRLELHLRMNGIHTVRVEPYAVGSGTSQAEFFEVIDGDATRSGLRPPSSSDRVAGIAVQTIQLDRYISDASIHRTDVVKLDVEGGELEVFRGANKLLTEFRPVIICEVLDAATRAWGYEAREIILALRRFDFEWFEFNPDGTLIPHAIKDHYPEVKNFLATPREKCSPSVEWLLR